MKDLDDYQEITNLNFNGEKPHLAICHKSQNYSANGRPDALLFKGKEPVMTEELLKSLGKVVGEEEVLKMSMQNKRDALQAALKIALSGNDDCCYNYPYVADFNDDMVAFYYDEGLYAVAYTADSTDNITFDGEPVLATRKELYVESETGQELIKALDFKPETSPIIEEVIIEEEEELTKSVNDQVQELLKAERVELLKSLREELKVEAAAEELQKSTTELVKGFSFVEEGSADMLVKALISCEGEFGVAILKSLEDASLLVKEANVKVEAAEAEVEEIKKEFGTKQSGKEGTPVVKGTGATAGAERTQDLAAFMKSRKK